MVHVTREAFLVVVLVSCIAGGVAGTLEDGLPRPSHFAEDPTTSYGTFPELTDLITGTTVDCEWYGFANTLYPVAIGMECLDEMRVALTNPVDNPPSGMRPYQYYSLRRMLDPANNQWTCYQGCFNLAPSGAPAPDVNGPMYAPAPSPSYYSPESSPAVAPAPESGL